MTETYRGAGVNIELAEKTIRDIKADIRSTHNQNVLTDIGHFGGMYLFEQTKYHHPVLVSSTDGVGTKLKIAFMTGKHDSVGEDLVNHCVNDIAVGGAKPLFFLDYFATAKLITSIFQAVVSGFVRGCRNNHCALIGGETAEMPDMYKEGEYDLSGTIVGVVEREKMIVGSKIQKSDVLIGLASNGLHTNGYSLARKILLKNFKIDQYVEDLGSTLGEELLRLHLSYLDTIHQLHNQFEINGFAHITGGGIEGNTSRLIGHNLNLNIDWQAWEIPPIFQIIQQTGKVPVEDMRRTFNLGIGLVCIVKEDIAQDVFQLINQLQIKASYIGSVV